MKRRACCTFVGALMVLGICSLSVSSAADDEEDAKAIKEAQGMVNKLTESMVSGNGNPKAQAEAIHKKFEQLKMPMWVFKPRDKGGIGMGPMGEGIELKLGSYSNPKKRINPREIMQLKDDLIKAGQISKAMAEVADLYAPKKDTAKWKKYAQDMRKGADELIEAAKSSDGVKIKKAASNLNSSCTNCHADFRND